MHVIRMVSTDYGKQTNWNEINIINTMDKSSIFRKWPYVMYGSRKMKLIQVSKQNSCSHSTFAKMVVFGV